MEAFEQAFEKATSNQTRAQKVSHGIIVAAVDKSGKLDFDAKKYN